VVRWAGSELGVALRGRLRARAHHRLGKGLALRDRVAPPTINLEDPDDDAGLTISPEPQPLKARSAAPMAVLNNSFGFGGHNVALAFTAA